MIRCRDVTGEDTRGEGVSAVSASWLRRKSEAYRFLLVGAALPPERDRHEPALEEDGDPAEDRRSLDEARAIVTVTGPGDPTYM
jgi:hypothetical protein